MAAVAGREQRVVGRVDLRGLAQRKASATASPPLGRVHPGSYERTVSSVSHMTRMPPGSAASACGAVSAEAGMSRPRRR